jgi:hypothetical protein
MGSPAIDILTMGGIMLAIGLAMALIIAGRRSALMALIGRLTILLAVAGLVVLVHYYSVHQEAQRQKRARDTIVLTSIEKQVDAINMFEDLVRIRFHYRNTTDREVTGFTVQFTLRDHHGVKLIEDEISIPASVGPRRQASWSATYWATCPQDFSPSVWELLTHQDIEDFQVEWEPVSLVFADGEVIR